MGFLDSSYNMTKRRRELLVQFAIGVASGVVGALVVAVPLAIFLLPFGVASSVIGGLVVEALLALL